jgi:hypothetical protein
MIDFVSIRKVSGIKQLTQKIFFNLAEDWIFFFKISYLCFTKKILLENILSFLLRNNFHLHVSHTGAATHRVAKMPGRNVR